MRITYGSAEIASDNLALGRVGPVGYTLNGRQFVEEVPFFQAATATFYGRGNRSVSVGFAVHRLFATPDAALRFANLHHNDLEDEGDLLLTLDTETLALEGAVLEGVDMEPPQGSAVVVRYTLRGSFFVGDADPLPEPDPAMTRSGLVNVPADALTVDVVFASPLPGVPFVPAAALYMPTAGGDVITAVPIEDTITAAGLTYALSGPPAASGYKLPYQAFYAA